jgi:hypothetical protein
MIDSDTLGRVTKFWENEVEMRDRIIASLRNDIATYNEVLTGLKNGEIAWDRVQIMETGQLKVTAPPQPIPDERRDTCVEEVSKEFGKRNGKKDDKEAETAVAELAEVSNGG